MVETGKYKKPNAMISPDMIRLMLEDLKNKVTWN